MIVLVYFLNLLFLFGVSVIVYRVISDSRIQKIYWPLLILKLIAGILLGLLYHYYYGGGDTIAYFEKATELAQLPWSDFWVTITSQPISSQPVRAIYFERMVGAVLFITQANYWIASLYFSFLSFLGALYFVIQVAKFRASHLTSAVLTFLVFPSVVFWSSGIMKESMAFAGLMVLAALYLKIINEQFKWVDVAGLLVSAFVLGLLKSYILIVAIPVFLLLIQDYYFKNYYENPLGTGTRLAVIGVVVLPASYFIFSFLFPNFHWNNLFNDIEISRQNIYQNSYRSLNVYSFTELGVFTPVVNFFHYLFSGIFRPQLFESWEFPVWLAAVENFVIMTLVGWKVYTIRLKLNLVTLEGFMVFAYILFLAWMLAYSLPNLGTISRMKVYYMPFFMFVVMKDHPVLNHLQKLKFLARVI